MDLQYTAHLASFILCVFLFARCSESACVVNGKTYNVGEAWQEIDQHPDCFQHVCLPDDTFKTRRCDPAQNDAEETVVETTANVNDLNLDRSLPIAAELATDKPDILSGCKLDGREARVGEQVDVPGKCVFRACAGSEQWIMKACPLIVLTPGWILTPVDVSKSYPYCCGREAPMLDIIPDVIQSLQWTVALKLSYNNNTVEYGNHLTPGQVEAHPAVDFWADPNSWYLLSMVDPDSPSRQNATSRAFLHWLVANIPGNDVSSGEVLAEYVGSGPRHGTGAHRYVFLLYKQPGNITFEEPILDNTNVEGRKKFSIDQLSNKYNLSDPIALNYFVAQYDGYVPEV